MLPQKAAEEERFEEYASIKANTTLFLVSFKSISKLKA